MPQVDPRKLNDLGSSGPAAPGRRLPSRGAATPGDQLDFAVGALLLTWSRVSLASTDAAVILGVTAGGHILVNHLGYWLGIRDTRW